MSNASHPRLEELLDAFERLADRVLEMRGHRLDPFVSVSLRRACEQLRKFVPGLDSPPDPEAARFLARAAYAALEDNDAREALSRALRGLSFAPHHPGLFYVAASACFEFGAVEDAMRLLKHVLWIHPGHTAARRDLDALGAYRRQRRRSRRDGARADAESGATSSPDWVDDEGGGPDLAFDFIADDTDAPHAGADDADPADEDEDRAA